MYLAGEYHLFYQHNPYGRNWGNMHWGHAVSRDLVRWTELPVALYPRRHGDWCYSGSALADPGNRLGLVEGDAPEGALLAFFTSTGRGECLAVSRDRGRTFTDHPRNPLVTHRGRDPKVIRYRDGDDEVFVMAVYDETDGKRGIAFHRSRDLLAWERTGFIEGFYECPELFALPVDGNPERRLWVLYAADGAYSLGAFDGRAFRVESGRPPSGKHRFNHGDCFYASQTFSDLPPEDGRRVQIAWGRTGHRDMPFNQQMNFPVVLTLRTTPEGGPDVRRTGAGDRGAPPGWGEDTRRDRGDRGGLASSGGSGPRAPRTLHRRSRNRRSGAPRAFRHHRDPRRGFDDLREVRRALGRREGPLTVEFILDRLSLELFADHGRIYMPLAVIPAETGGLGIHARGGTARIRELEIHGLGSAWGGE